MPEANLETRKLDALTTSPAGGAVSPHKLAPVVSPEPDKMKEALWSPDSELPSDWAVQFIYLWNKPIVPVSYQNTKNQRLRAC